MMHRGEAFDKIARILDLPQPGGPAVERAAADGDPRPICVPASVAGPARL